MYEIIKKGNKTFNSRQHYFLCRCSACGCVYRVVPISRGGRHSWNNVKLAHRLCNTVKRDKGYPPP